MIIEIGNKSLKNLTSKNLLDIVLLEGVYNSLEYWNEPEIIDFDNTTFGDTIVLDSVSYRKEDNAKGCIYSFFFCIDDFTFHYTKIFEDSERVKVDLPGQRINLKTIKYLIKEGFDVPIY